MLTEHKRPMGFMRWIFAIFGVLVMVFTGGCFIILGLNSIDEIIREPTVIGIPLFFSGIPFAIGLGLWWLAVKTGR